MREEASESLAFVVGLVAGLVQTGEMEVRKERALAEQLKNERAQAEAAARRGDRPEQRAYEKRAVELARQLDQESIQAIDLEEKLAALEEKLTLAQEAVEKQAKNAELKAEEAAKVMAQGGGTTETVTSSSSDSTQAESTTNELTDDEARLLLAANFDRALDARYAVARGYVWSVFIHPLSLLTDAQFIDGVSQVVTLADTYGTSYTSTDLVFQGGQN